MTEPNSETFVNPGREPIVPNSQTFGKLFWCIFVVVGTAARSGLGCRRLY